MTEPAAMAEWEPGVDREPWLRQPRESGTAYAEFIAYRDMGPGRSLALHAERHGAKYDTVKKKAQRGRWSERARAWDQFVQRTRDATRAVAEQRQRDRQTDLSHRLAMKFGESLGRMPDASVDELGVMERVRVAESMGRLHHQLTGPAVPGVQVNTTVSAAASAQAAAVSAAGEDAAHGRDAALRERLLAAAGAENAHTAAGPVGASQVAEAPLRALEEAPGEPVRRSVVDILRDGDDEPDDDHDGGGWYAP